MNPIAMLLPTKMNIRSVPVSDLTMVLFEDDDGTVAIRKSSGEDIAVGLTMELAADRAAHMGYRIVGLLRDQCPGEDHSDVAAEMMALAYSPDASVEDAIELATAGKPLESVLVRAALEDENMCCEIQDAQRMLDEKMTSALSIIGDSDTGAGMLESLQNAGAAAVNDIFRAGQKSVRRTLSQYMEQADAIRSST